MSHYAIIVAGGIGTRMKSDVPKQFLLLKGIPILMHTVRAFQQYSVTLVLPKNQHEYWSELCGKYHFEVAHDVVSGGSSRSRSVKNGLENIPNQGLVAIHDGVRPLVGSKVIEQSFILAKKYGNAIATTALKDSIREVTKNSNKAVDRSRYQLVQTPQTFDIALIKKAYQQQESPLFTDDASVLENDGHSIHLFEGCPSNIKITTPEDMRVAEELIK